MTASDQRPGRPRRDVDATAVGTVVIGIPTYRRPDLLDRLLTSLTPEVGRDVPVIVADNEAGDHAPAVVARADLDAVCVPVTRPGISEVRNALVREATKRHPDWEVLVMLDDDGFVTAGWFDALMRGVARYDADVTAGPVHGSLPEGASILARNSVYAGRRTHVSGPVGMLNGAQNIAVRRRIVDAIGDPWFPLHLGRTGGEDHFFFREVLDQGGTLAWCADAPVTEPTPADRLTSQAILRRAYRANRVATQTDLAFLGPAHVTRRLAVDTGWFLRNTAAALVRRDTERIVRNTLDMAALGGRVAGLARSSAPTRSHTGL